MIRPSGQRGSYANLIGHNGWLTGSETVLGTNYLKKDLAVYAKFVSINSKDQTRDETEFWGTAVQPTPTVQAPLSIRTWAFTKGDAVAIMPDRAMRGTETPADAYGRTWHRSRWLVARRWTRGSTVHPYTTSVAHCQHSLSSPMWTTIKGRSMTSFCLKTLLMTIMMMSGFVERVINNPQTRYRSAKQAGLRISSQRQRGESCGSLSGW